MLQMKELYAKAIMKFTYNTVNKDVPAIFHNYFFNLDIQFIHTTPGGELILDTDDQGLNWVKKNSSISRCLKME